MPLLSDLLTLPVRPLIAIVGAGGKTTTMYTLAVELAQRGKRVITTTTTNIYLPEKGETDAVIVSAETLLLLKMVSAAWKQYSRITVAGMIPGSGKLAGLQPEQPYELVMKSGADVVIVEADGARHRRIKAPAAHEPAVPVHTNVALLVMSAEAINQPLNSEVAHRPEQVATVTGIKAGDILSPQVLARLMTSEQGGLKDIPETAAVYVLLTHVRVDQWDELRELVVLIQNSPRISGVFCSSQPDAWFLTDG